MFSFSHFIRIFSKCVIKEFRLNNVTCSHTENFAINYAIFVVSRIGSANHGRKLIKSMESLSELNNEARITNNNDGASAQHDGAPLINWTIISYRVGNGT